MIHGTCASSDSSRISTGQPVRVIWALFLSADLPSGLSAPSEDSVHYLII